MNRDPKNSSQKAQVLIVDDHPILREGIVQLINQEKDLMVCGSAENASQALESIKKLQPDIAIVDLSLGGMHGIDLIKNIKVQYDKLPVLVLSMHDESLYAERVLRAGARGYIMKHEATGKVLVAIRKVLNGKIYVSEKMASMMIEKSISGPSEKTTSTIDLLSDRELEVFHLIGKGLGTRQIAKELHLSVKTVETYREHIKYKMKFKTSTEMVRHAIQWVETESLGKHN